MKWRNIMLLSLLCLSCAGLYAQENMKVNSIKQEKDSLKILSEGAVVFHNRVDMLPISRKTH